MKMILITTLIGLLSFGGAAVAGDKTSRTESSSEFISKDSGPQENDSQTAAKTDDTTTLSVYKRRVKPYL